MAVAGRGRGNVLKGFSGSWKIGRKTEKRAFRTRGEEGY